MITWQDAAGVVDLARLEDLVSTDDFYDPILRQLAAGSGAAGRAVLGGRAVGAREVDLVDVVSFLAASLDWGALDDDDQATVLEAVVTFPGLAELELWGCTVLTDDNIVEALHAGSAASPLARLRLAFCPNVTVVGLTRLVAVRPNLAVELDHNPSIGVPDWEALLSSETWLRSRATLALVVNSCSPSVYEAHSGSAEGGRRGNRTGPGPRDPRNSRRNTTDGSLSLPTAQHSDPLSRRSSLAMSASSDSDGSCDGAPRGGLYSFDDAASEGSMYGGVESLGLGPGGGRATASDDALFPLRYQDRSVWALGRGSDVPDVDLALLLGDNVDALKLAEVFFFC